MRYSLSFIILVFSVSLKSQTEVVCDTFVYTTYGDWCESFEIGCVEMESKYFDSLSYDQVHNIPMIGCDGCQEVSFNTRMFEIGYCREVHKYLSFLDFKYNLLGHILDFGYSSSTLKIIPKRNKVFNLIYDEHLDYNLYCEIFLNGYKMDHLSIGSLTYSDSIGSILLKNIAIEFNQDARCYNRVEFPDLNIDIMKGY